MFNFLTTFYFTFVICNVTMLITTLFCQKASTLIVIEGVIFIFMQIFITFRYLKQKITPLFYTIKYSKNVLKVSISYLELLRLGKEFKINKHDIRFTIYRRMVKEFIKLIEFSQKDSEAIIYEVYTWVIKDKIEERLLNSNFKVEEKKPKIFQLFILSIVYKKIHGSKNGFNRIKQSKWLKISWSPENAKHFIYNFKNIRGHLNNIKNT